MKKSFRFRYSAPPPKLLVVFAGTEIGELTEEKGIYTFHYLPAFSELNLAPIPGFPEIEKEYRSVSLFPYFAERIPDRKRPEIAKLLRERNLENASPIQLLAELGVHSVTDPFSIRNANAA